MGYHSFVALTVTAFEVGDDECDLTTDNCLAPWETDAKLIYVIVTYFAYQTCMSLYVIRRLYGIDIS